MNECKHHIVNGTSETSENICSHDVCGLCRRFVYETHISCIKCGKNVCIKCVSLYQNAEFAMHIPRRLLTTYRESPESATTLFGADSRKVAVFREYKNLMVVKAEVELACASAVVVNAKIELACASERLNQARLDLEAADESIASVV